MMRTGRSDLFEVMMQKSPKAVEIRHAIVICRRHRDEG